MANYSPPQILKTMIATILVRDLILNLCSHYDFIRGNSAIAHFPSEKIYL